MNLLFDASVKSSKRVAVDGDGFYSTFGVHMTRVITNYTCTYYIIIATFYRLNTYTYLL